jgi:signal peptidase II
VKRSLLLLLAVAIAVVSLDYATKQWVMANLAFERPVEILGPFVRLTYTRNSGVAFGLGAGTSFPFYIFSIIAAIAILYLFVRTRIDGLVRRIALALIFGGAIGNLIDRVRWGEVVDFLQIGTERWYWPAFNVADAAVSVGVVLFALTWSRDGDTAGEADVAADPVGASDAGVEGDGTERGGPAGPVPRGGTGGPVA